MAERTDDPNPLLTLARRCVVRVEDSGGRFLGSGFFVLPGVVVTCGHVVHGASGVRVVWGEASPADVERVVAVPPREGVRSAAEYPLPDLALLHLAGTEAVAGHPCVRLAVDVPGGGADPDRFYAAGYTGEHDTSVPALNGAIARFESTYAEPPHELWKLQEGEVPRGLSGGLLLNLRTGDVGVVESSRDVRAPRGGFAVPVAEVDAAFPELLSANQSLHDDGMWARAVEDEATRAAEREGLRARLPLVAPVVDLAWRPGGSTTELLRPVYGVVPYVGRERLRRAMADWCEARGDEAVGLWFVTGGGGFGKTRLGMELCVSAGQAGWTTGLLDPTVTGADPRLAELAAWPGRLLVVIDYAEARPAAVKELVKQLRWRRAPVRIVALVRRRMTRAELVDHFDVVEGTVELAEPGEHRLADVLGHAAPFEAADFARRLRAHAVDHPEIAELVEGLAEQLTAPDTGD